MSKRAIIFFSTVSLITLGMFFTVRSYAVSPGQNTDSSVSLDLGYEQGEIIVRFKPKQDGKQQTLAEKNGVLSSINGGTVKHSYELVPGLTVVKLPPEVNVKDAVAKLNKAQGILYAQPNYILKVDSTFPNDTNFAQLWGMNNTGQTGGSADADIDAPEAWDIETNANAIIVAVIDTGVDYTHPDLAANMWTNANGYHGYDFCTFGGHQRDSDPMDDNGHGTHCAGIIGAKGNNGVGVTGVCWNVKIMALKLFDSYGNGNTVDAIDCIEYAVNNGAKVLSNSWGGLSSNPMEILALKDEIEAADANGVLFIASAGNDGIDNDNDEYRAYPASYDCNNIISVMATDSNDARSIWNYGRSTNWGAVSVDLAAPGSVILSCVPYSVCNYDVCHKYYESWGGTSMAAPHVAGACALVWSVNPSLSHLQVKDIILKSVDKLPSLDGLSVTEGRLNLYNALVEALKNEQILSNVDNIAEGHSVLPNDEITYTIHYANTVTNPSDPNYIGTLTNVSIIDYLPPEVNIQNPFDPAYNDANRTYTWNIGTLSPGNSGSGTLTVTVNNLAEPLGKIKNMCKMTSDQIRPVFATEITDVNS
jgi:serine protease